MAPRIIGVFSDRAGSREHIELPAPYRPDGMNHTGIIDQERTSRSCCAGNEPAPQQVPCRTERSFPMQTSRCRRSHGGTGEDLFDGCSSCRILSRTPVFSSVFFPCSSPRPPPRYPRSRMRQAAGQAREVAARQRESAGGERGRKLSDSCSFSSCMPFTHRWYNAFGRRSG